MRKTGWIPILALCAASATLPAKEFPLTFKTLTVDEAFSLPVGPGTLGNLRVAKPPAVKNQPKTVSKHPLYGELGFSRLDKGFTFRLDESTGDGKGYDQLLMDLNQNGDLTDDPVVKLAGTPRISKLASETRELSRFGPIEAPATKSIGKIRPVYFAELNHYRRPNGANDPDPYLGYLRLRAGSYFGTTVELDGIHQEVGVTDGNANFQFGDEAQSRTYQSSGTENWSFAPADFFLRDADGSGKFEGRPGDPESSPFGPILYLGATPYHVTLAKDCTSLSVEPWKEPLATVSVAPTGKQVREVLVGWEHKPKEWRLLKAGVAQGQAKLPPGKLRLTGCVLEAKTADGQSLVLSGSYRKTDKAIEARVGKEAVLRCGAPLEVKMTAEKRATAAGGAMYEADTTATPGAAAIRIQAEILGAGGETYATFARGKDLAGEPPKPQFTIKTADGKQVGSGNLEFG